jgi:metal-responsive CopG/Arc/MetJ family transcriptional regulator
MCIHYGGSMIRTQVYISQSELIRNAIDSFIKTNNKENKNQTLINAFGMWESNDHDFQQTRESMDR